MPGARDGELLDRARQGDAPAFGMLIRPHDKHLYRIARSVLSDDQEAEDAVQETFIRMFTGLRDFRGTASLRTWLTRIVLTKQFDVGDEGGPGSISPRCRPRRSAVQGPSIPLR